MAATTRIRNRRAARAFWRRAEPWLAAIICAPAALALLALLAFAMRHAARGIGA